MYEFSKIKNVHIMPAFFPSKVKFSQRGNYRQLKELAIRAGESTVYASTEKHKKFISTLITSRMGVPLGKHTFAYNFNTNTLEGGYIETLSENRGKGIGEIMRLLSIINMRENNLKRIDIRSSLTDAITFHSKYKFQPNIKEDNFAIAILTEITNKLSVRKEHREQAFNLRTMMRKGASIEKDEEFAQRLNIFVDDYIIQHAANWNETGFSYPIPMTLTKERIKEFAEFFNTLFKKHKIAYEIK